MGKVFPQTPKALYITAHLSLSAALFTYCYCYLAITVKSIWQETCTTRSFTAS